MELSLKPELRKFIEDKVRAGDYGSAEEVVEAGLAALRQHEGFGDFEAGEMDGLLEEGERSIREEGTVDAGEVFAGLRRKAAERRPGTESGNGK